MRSGALPPVRTVPFPDQLPLKSAKGPEAADAGRSGRENAETRATSQQPRKAAGENGEKRPNVRCKGEAPRSKSVAGEADLSPAFYCIWGGSGSRMRPHPGIYWNACH